MRSSLITGKRQELEIFILLCVQSSWCLLCKNLGGLKKGLIWLVVMSKGSELRQERMPQLSIRLSGGTFELARRCFTQAQKLLILRRSGYKCQCCGTPLTEENFEADHKLPFSKGGATEVWNALALCASCNKHKSDKLEYEV